MKTEDSGTKRFRHTKRPGFWLGFIDFFTAGLFFLLYMPFGGLQKELEAVLGHRVMPYWKAYLLGIPTLFLYPLVWMARIAEELKKKAIGLGIDGPYTSWRHMFGWNTLGILLFGPAVATHRFFDTLNKIEARLNEDEARPNEDKARRNRDAEAS
ncbi:MAG: DUF4234 domain-containing protein [Lachnospiraceae bacterium]|nr:DUF4234 domain-containing protein [Lachnospiraceae bacterium]